MMARQASRTMRRSLAGWWAGACLLAACSDPASTTSPPASAPRLAADGAIAVEVVIPPSAGPGLQLAAADLAGAIAARVGQPARAPLQAAAPSSGVVVAASVDGDAAALGPEGFVVARHAWASGAVGLRVRGATAVGAAHGLRWVAEQLGVRWIHPEQTYLPPVDAAARLPWPAAPLTQRPRFAFRGLHEHTQHPIPASDFVLQPELPDHAAMFSRWIRYIARNRNNVASVHMLKTVNLPAFLPRLQAMVAEAAEHGVQLGMVTSFADQQQNNYKHIDELRLGIDGKVVPDAVQIRDSLDALLGTGMGWIALQIGTSEFTKPKDAVVLGWIDTALAHIASKFPNVKTYAWIHTTCSLQDEQGGYFYHLPLQAPAALGAWAHTTMFYDLDRPAPVYDCETFQQQRAFLDQAKGTRELVYFPETAWWLGFDNNLPLALHLTGASRHRDAASLDAAVTGHVTFTTGREWGYWMYDHHVLRLGWDATVSWAAWLQDMAPVFGPHGAKVADVLARWAARQEQDHLVHNPMITFYLAGELPQDEIGAAAGILARRPKPAFGTVLQYDATTWESWTKGDLADLAAMLPAYQAMLDELPAGADATASGAVGAMQAALYDEIRDGLWVHVQRIAHTLALYEGVVALRPWQLEKAQAQAAGKEPDAAVRSAAMAAAEAKLAAAKTIGLQVAARLQAAEARYRYPLAMLARPKPQTLTSYPFGYLEQTSTAYFWTRREAQLATLMTKVAGTGAQAWTTKPSWLGVSTPAGTTLVKPDHPVAKGVLPGFVPRLLWGATAQGGATAATVTLLVATDFDANGLPDAGSEQQVALQPQGAHWQGTLSPFSLTVQDSAGSELGTLHLLDATFAVAVEVAGDAVKGLTSVEVQGATPTPAFLAMLQQVGGIDDAGASALLKNVFGVPADQPLPATLPVAFRFVPASL